MSRTLSIRLGAALAALFIGLAFAGMAMALGGPDQYVDPGGGSLYCRPALNGMQAPIWNLTGTCGYGYGPLSYGTLTVEWGWVQCCTSPSPACWRYVIS